MRIVVQAAFWALTCMLCTMPARAGGMDLFSRETFSLSGDVRLVGVDGERSWLDRETGLGGFGKGRFGSDGGFRIRAEPTEATLTWQPRFSWSLSGTVVAVAQKGQSHALDLSEAFLSLKPKAEGPVRLSLRAGLFWPPVSLEHSGRDWMVTETITPSAINSWISEEVKLVGAEATVSVPLGEGRLAATVALFGYNDTAGTLLAFRGWALHDQKAVAFSRQPLPPQNAFITAVQSAFTSPVIELDNRVGYYTRLAWSPPANVRLEALYYDNRGDPQEANPARQWGWRTRFVSVGMVAAPGDRLELRAQGMAGTTRMGFPRNGVIWIDTHFRSAFLLATRRVNQGSISARFEAFGTSNRGSRLLSDDSESGWAATLAARRPIGDHAALLLEVEHVNSRRPARARLGDRSQQQQTWVQLALRLRL